LKESFDEALNLHDFTVLFKMTKEIAGEKFVMTGEFSRMMNLINITVLEMTCDDGHYLGATLIMGLYAINIFILL